VGGRCCRCRCRALLLLQVLLLQVLLLLRRQRRAGARPRGLLRGAARTPPCTRALAGS
jgi:hypothetical protein